MPFVSVRRLPAVIAAAAMLSVALIPALAAAQQGQMNPKISIDAINERKWPFDYDCGAGALQSPITVRGSGSDDEPSGIIEQYSVQIEWGDGAVELADAVFTPPSGQGGFTMTYSAGPHAYAVGGGKTITVTLYHSQLPGEDNIKVGSASATICIAPKDDDKDGMDDRWETANGLNPADPTDAAKDDDGDGLHNFDEYAKGGDPRKADTDGDGMPDLWEFDNGLALDAADADQDPDGDGRDNLTEYRDGTDPQKADKVAGWKTGAIAAVLALLAVLAVLLMRKKRPPMTGKPGPMPAGQG